METILLCGFYTLSEWYPLKVACHKVNMYILNLQATKTIINKELTLIS